MKLNNEEMLAVNGGAISLKFAGVLGSIVVFIIGLVDGLIHPKKCN